MKRLLFYIFVLFTLEAIPVKAETSNYVFVMFYGNDSEPLLTTIQVDESLKVRLEKRNVKFDWSDTAIPRDILILEGKRIKAECDLTEYNETWCVTDASQRILGISEIFPVGREISWFRILEYNNEFAIEAPGKDIDVSIYNSMESEYSESEIPLNKGKRFIFNFEGEAAKIGPSGVQFLIRRK